VAEIRNNLSTIVDIPAIESQGRPLARLTVDQQLIAWQKAIETAPEGKVTVAMTMISQLRWLGFYA